MTRREVGNMKPSENTDDHTIPSVHVECELGGIPETVSPAYDSTPGMVVNKKLGAINATRLYKPEEIGWLGDK